MSDEHAPHRGKSTAGKIPHSHVGRSDQAWTTLNGWPDLVHAHRYDPKTRGRRTGPAYVGTPWEHTHEIPKQTRTQRRDASTTLLPAETIPGYAAGLRVAFDLMLDARLNPEDTTNA